MGDMACKHGHIAEPAPGKYLRVCLDCCHRLIECSTCDAKLVAGPEVSDSGWVKEGITGEVNARWTYCPVCARR